MSELSGFANMSSVTLIQPNSALYNPSTTSKANSGCSNHAPAQWQALNMTRCMAELHSAHQEQLWGAAGQSTAHKHLLRIGVIEIRHTQKLSHRACLLLCSPLTFVLVLLPCPRPSSGPAPAPAPEVCGEYPTANSARTNICQLQKINIQDYCFQFMSDHNWINSRKPVYLANSGIFKTSII